MPSPSLSSSSAPPTHPQHEDDNDCYIRKNHLTASYDTTNPPSSVIIDDHLNVIAPKGDDKAYGDVEFRLNSDHDDGEKCCTNMKNYRIPDDDDDDEDHDSDTSSSYSDSLTEFTNSLGT